MEEEAVVENIIIYIPVAEDTEGGTPMLNSKGLKMAPPPNPKAPEAQPPKKAKNTSFFTVFLSKRISESTIPTLNLSLSLYSSLILLMQKKVTPAHNTQKASIIVQSIQLHLEIPTREGTLLLPLRRETLIKAIRITEQMRCLSHYIFVLSFSRIFYSLFHSILFVFWEAVPDLLILSMLFYSS